MATPTARETILSTIQSELWQIEWNDAPIPLVERNLRRMATIDQIADDLSAFPTLFIVPLPDKKEQTTRHTSDEVNTERSWSIGIAIFLQGSTEDEAPLEIEAFGELVDQAMFRAGDKLRCGVHDGDIDEILYPECGNSLVFQMRQYEVIYVNQVIY